MGSRVASRSRFICGMEKREKRREKKEKERKVSPQGCVKRKRARKEGTFK